MSGKPAGDRPGVLLRDMLLTAKPSAFHIEPVSELPRVWAALMELRRGGVLVSLAAVCDGTTSLYFSNGGGVIGGGEHDSVRAANRKAAHVHRDRARAVRTDRAAARGDGRRGVLRRPDIRRHAGRA